jgi:hypothetical protein
MAILELVVNQSYANQVVINRFHFVSSGTPAAVSLSFGLIAATGFLDTSAVGNVFPVNTLANYMQQAAHSSLQYVSTYARNLYDPTDFYERPYVDPTYGILSGTATTPALAYGIQSNRVRTDIRRGSKRFAGVREESLGTGGYIESGTIGVMSGICDLLNAPISYDDEGATLSYRSTILSFKEYTTPRGNRAYEKWPTESAQLARSAIGVTWAPMNPVRTQVSRQYGRGV